MYFDAFAMKEIKEIIDQKVSYLYPGYPSQTEVNVAYGLNIPILTGNYLNRFMFSLSKGAN